MIPNRMKLLPAIVLCLMTAGGVRAADVTGVWKAEFDTQVGMQKYVFTLKQDGDKITGKAAADIEGEKHEAELKNGKIEGDTIVFVEEFEFQGMEISIAYQGKIAGDKIQFTRNIGEFATEKFVASRQAPPACPRAGGRGTMRMPKPGPCPLPILPALASYADTSFYAKTDVPHGKVEQANYRNYAGVEKRMHIYLPPNYETNTQARYPVLYLNHGGGDDDAKWSSTNPRDGGNAQFILDNLIAAGKAKPMILVMPNTRGIASANPPVLGQDDACTQEYLKDIIPYVESHYRVKPGRENRALAGLSMGGFVVMNTGLSHLDTFGELYIYSSGYFDDQRQAFEDHFHKVLADPNTNDLLRTPLYMAAGETDIALFNSQKTLSVFNKYGIRNFWVLSTGGHEWANWRRYLHQTAQIMFPD